jgi:hypothetical protein
MTIIKEAEEFILNHQCAIPISFNSFEEAGFGSVKSLSAIELCRECPNLKRCMDESKRIIEGLENEIKTSAIIGGEYML